MKDAAFMSIVPKQEDAKTKIVYMGERLKRNKMGMSIDKAKEWLKLAVPIKALTHEEFAAFIQAVNLAVDVMCKYQKIQEIYQKWNEVNDFAYNQAMSEIGKVIESEEIPND